MNKNRYIIIAIILILVFKTAKAGEVNQKSEMIISIKNEMVSMSAKDADLETILEEIIKQSDCRILLEIQEGRKITDRFENLPINEAIERILNNNYAILKDGNKIVTVITPKRKNFTQSDNQKVMDRNDEIKNKTVAESTFKTEPPPFFFPLPENELPIIKVESFVPY